MTHEKSDTQINSSLFEGPEKLLEIWFAPSAADVPDFNSATNGKFGLRKVDRSIWEDMLNVVKCKVLSYIEGDEMDAYLLSESSFFVSPHRLILKTCGTTLNLLGLPRILEIARDHASLESVYRCFYSRKAFMFPERQPSPHRHWTDEVGFLDGIFANGAAYTVGKVNGDHWLLYLTCPPECDEIPPAQRLASQQPTTNPTPIDSAPPDFTIEILMSDLSSDNCRPFFLKEDGSAIPPDHAQRLSSTLGISDIFPPHLTTLDAYSFSPCGYSANAIIRWGEAAITDDTNDVKNAGSYQNIEGYYTIHVTPEEGASYASFECNVPLLTSTSPPSSSASHLRLAESIPDLHTLIQRVVGIFRPGRLSLTLFISSNSGADVEDDNGDTAVEAAQRTFKAALTTCISKAASDSGDMEIQHSYYKRTDKINYEFGGYDLAFASFELLRR